MRAYPITNSYHAVKNDINNINNNMCENSFGIAFRFKLPTVKLKKMEDFFSRLYKIAGNNHLLDVIEAKRKNNVEKKDVCY